MNAVAALAAFLVAAGLLTLTPGLDTMLVLRTAATDGRRTALMAAVGIGLGCLVWGAAVALGLGVLLTASPRAYAVLTWAGAVYLAWVGLSLLLRPRRSLPFSRMREKVADRPDEGTHRPVTPLISPAADLIPQPGEGSTSSGLASLLRGLLTNLLNPKIGVFYVSFLPQFVPAGWPASPVVFGLAALHVLMGLLWMSVVIGGVGALQGALRRPGVIAWLDRTTGIVFIAFGLRLALSRPA